MPGPFRGARDEMHRFLEGVLTDTGSIISTVDYIFAVYFNA